MAMFAGRRVFFYNVSVSFEIAYKLHTLVPLQSALPLFDTRSSRLVGFGPTSWFFWSCRVGG